MRNNIKNMLSITSFWLVGFIALTCANQEIVKQNAAHGTSMQTADAFFGSLDDIFDVELLVDREVLTFEFRTKHECLVTENGGNLFDGPEQPRFTKRISFSIEIHPKYSTEQIHSLESFNARMIEEFRTKNGGHEALKGNSPKVAKIPKYESECFSYSLIVPKFIPVNNTDKSELKENLNRLFQSWTIINERFKQGNSDSALPEILSYFGV